MRRAKLVTAVLVATSILSLAAVVVRSEPPPTRTPGQNSVFIEDSYCKVGWADERTISSKIPGRIMTRNVDDGSIVKADEILAVLDDADAELQYRIQKLLGESRLGEEIAKSKRDEYDIRKDAAIRLISSLAISREDYRLAFVNLVVNELQLKQEAEKHEQESLKAELAKVNLDEHKITSPIAGIVAKCFKRVGESVSPNDLQMFRVVAMDRLWVDAQVPSQYLHRVRKGQRVLVQPVYHDVPRKGEPPAIKVKRPLPGAEQPFEGHVLFIAPDVDHASSRFVVRAEVQNRGELLRAGLRMETTIFFSDTASESDNTADPRAESKKP